MIKNLKNMLTIHEWDECMGRSCLWNRARHFLYKILRESRSNYGVDHRVNHFVLGTLSSLLNIVVHLQHPAPPAPWFDPYRNLVNFLLSCKKLLLVTMEFLVRVVCVCVGVLQSVAVHETVFQTQII